MKVLREIYRNEYVFFVFSLIIMFFIFYLLFLNKPYLLSDSSVKDKVLCNDLSQIEEKGNLQIGISNNSLHYFILQGEPYGFQFELIRNYARHINVNLNIKIINGLDEQIKKLIIGDIHIACLDFPVGLNKYNEQHIQKAYITFSKYVIVSKKSEENRINKIEKLKGAKIYIPANSALYDKYKMYFDLLGVKLVEVPFFDSEQLIDAVVDDKINYTISDEPLARYKKKLQNRIEIIDVFDLKMPIHWLIRSCSYQLRDSFKSWLQTFKTTNAYLSLYNRYFINQPVSYKLVSKFFSGTKGNISQYDKLLKEESRKIGWDWRLISALIYEESHFRHDLVSSMGAYGIMQFMPVTAERFGVNDSSSAEEHIIAGIKYIRYLENIFIEKVPSFNERIKFVLASYNIGSGHILDAMALAAKYGKNPSFWDKNTEYFLLMKKQPLFYSDEVVKNGYLNAKTTVKFVKNVLSRYEHYRNNFPE